MAGLPRAKIWRLYMAGLAIEFERGLISVNHEAVAGGLYFVTATAPQLIPDEFVVTIEQPTPVTIP